LRPVFQPGDPDPASVVINEINYKSAGSFDPGDWIELAQPFEHDDCHGRLEIQGQRGFA